MTYYYEVSDDYVYLDEQIVGTTGEVYQEAYALADTGVLVEDTTQVTATESDQWLPLGLFGVVSNVGDKPEIMIQMALDREGNIAGSYYNTTAEVTLPLIGSVEQDTQRVAWKIGETDPIVMQTGLENLSKESSTVLVFFSDGTSETWTLERQDEETARTFLETNMARPDPSEVE